MEKVTLEKINEIRKSVDIVDVISRYLNVVKKGRNYFAICPFHNDTNPSLSISREKQIYKCFVCGEGGNVITFIQKYKKISFIEALKEVALIGGIELQLDVKKSVSVDPKKQVLYDLLEDATKYYQSALASSQLAQDYIQKRNLSDAVLHEFRIGYSLDADKLIKYLKSKQYREEDILRSGIAIETEQGELKDRFANRLIFPLQDLNGNIVGFSGRIIQKSDMAKYINSPETEIFIKGDTFYHYYAALNSIKKSKKVYLCEGFMDVIAYFKSTIPHAIALMGTAFTKNHLKALKYLGVEVILSLDGDQAGKTATLKLAEELEKENIHLSIVSNYDDVKDADEYYTKYGMNAFLLKVQNPISLFDFYLQEMNALIHIENFEERKSFAKKMCKYLANKDLLEVDYYVDRLAEKLKFSKPALLQLIDQEKKQDVEVKTNFKINQRLFKRNEKILSDVLFQMIHSKEAIEYFKDQEAYFHMPNDQYKVLAMYILDCYLENQDFQEADLYSYIANLSSQDDEVLKTLTNILNTHEDQPIYTFTYFKNLIYEINECMSLEQKIEALKENLRFSLDSEKGEISNEIISLNQILKKKKYGIK